MRTSAVHPPPLHLLILLLLPSLINSDDLIDQTCKKTPFYDLCAATLHSNSSASSASDIKSLASSATNLVLSNATDTLTYIQLQLKQARDPKLEKALANCAELYIPVVKYNLPQAIEAFVRGYYGFTKYALSDASKQADACQKSLAGGGGEGAGAAELSVRNKLVSDLCGVGAAIVGLLMKVKGLGV
ncbi:Cell wall / vacuolar inhibitor of fructosidase 1 [Linum perenne]